VDGQKRIVARIPIAGTGWVAGASQVEREIMANLYRTLAMVFVLVLGVVVVSVLAARLITNKIVRPMRLLRDHAFVIGQGDLVHRTDIEGISELQDLSRTFNQMAERLRNQQEALQKLNEELESRVRSRTAELERSNAELERFAYVASHDLQEPLRMVASFVQLLQQRYSNRLDEQADEYIEFAVNGAKRMQKLLGDLLAYARINVRGRAFAPVDCENLLELIKAQFKSRLEECNGSIMHDPLPTVLADETQLLQVFENLIDNAIKFRSTRPLHIHICAQRKGDEWRFSVRDNGSGIEPVYFKRIFVIFQRLHTSRLYSGTGIGLALCKRIIERHGGKIWLESVPGEGSTFYFSLPVREKELSEYSQTTFPQPIPKAYASIQRGSSPRKTRIHLLKQERFPQPSQNSKKLFSISNLWKRI